MKATMRLLWEPSLCPFGCLWRCTPRPGSCQVGVPMLVPRPQPVRRQLEYCGWAQVLSCSPRGSAPTPPSAAAPSQLVAGRPIRTRRTCPRFRREDRKPASWRLRLRSVCVWESRLPVLVAEPRLRSSKASLRAVHAGCGNDA